jgi:hypothetical protein
MATMKFSTKVSNLACAGAALAPTHAWAQVMTNPIPVPPSDYPNERVSVAEWNCPKFRASDIPRDVRPVLPQTGFGTNYISKAFLAVRHFEINAETAYTKPTSNGATFGLECNRFEFGINLVGRL